MGRAQRTGKEFKRDHLADWAAALTCYAVLSIFPALLAVISILGLFGQPAARPLMDLGEVAPGARQILIVMMVLALLYWAGPNVEHPGFRWLTPGSALAVIIWIIASAAFAFHVAHFASYSKTYATLAGMIVFLIWL